jgi:hypothetical protein
VSGLSRLTLLDISRNQELRFNNPHLHGSISTISRLTALQYLSAHNVCIHAENAAQRDDRTAAICGHLANLTRLTFLLVGVVRTELMVIPAGDAAQLSALTGLRQLQLHGALLGPGSDKLDWLGALTRLTQLR